MPDADGQSAADDPAVVINGASKSFRLPGDQVHTLKERVLHPLRGSTHETLNALEDVSFTVDRGEFFGIVGRNGSGKSTLLKCMAGVYRLDAGQIFIDGRISTFIELGVGFNPDLTAQDNVTINGVMMGLTPREAAGRFEQVIEFAELEDFTEMKLKNYSSGMEVRLAFSVAIQVDADVMLIDEVLAVGDAAFQQKCFDVFYEMRDRKKTVLLVTHDMASVTRFCDRAALLDGGKLVDLGDPEEVADSYLALNFRGKTPGSGDREAAGEPEREGDGGAEIVDAWFEDQNGNRLETITQGASVTFCAEARFEEAVRHPEWAVRFEDAERHPLFATGTVWAGIPSEERLPGETSVFRVDFEVPFAPGRIYTTLSISHRGSGHALIDLRKRFRSVVVTGSHHSGGMLMVPHDVSLRVDDPGTHG
ncbi:MAG: ABC transporter ATP-binding protein [Verrucomicrobia bacterium]|nr:ABC transporter ATP-binding protein [Verrucomicrobiota bacterium]